MKKKEYKKLLEDIDRILAKRKRIFDRREEKRKRLVIEINVRYKDWILDCPRDQNKPASYRSSYMKGWPLGEYNRTSYCLRCLSYGGVGCIHNL